MNENLKIAVIGAGPAGLVALKYALQNGYQCEVFEQTDSLGGNWVYKDEVDIDKSGIKVHSSLYKDLIINVPKELMTYPDFNYPSDLRASYIGHREVLSYLCAYAEEFNLKNHIQYCQCVVNVAPIEAKWMVTVQDVRHANEKSKEFDAVFVCNGRFKSPVLPTINGQQLFEGNQIHSGSFRVPDSYENQKVLVVGGGHSATEITEIISKVAQHVYISYRNPLEKSFASNVTRKPEVALFTTNEAIFIDGTKEDIHQVIYCTGYTYSGSFLSSECGLVIQNRGVAPLFKQIVNINYPTMFFIGMPYEGSGNVLFDLQVRFVMSILRKTFVLPTKQEMLEEWEDLLRMKDGLNIPREHVHRFGNPQNVENYSTELAKTANIKSIPPFYFKLYKKVWKRKRSERSYRIVDEETFEEIQI